MKITGKDIAQLYIKEDTQKALDKATVLKEKMTFSQEFAAAMRNKQPGQKSYHSKVAGYDIALKYATPKATPKTTAPKVAAPAAKPSAPAKVEPIKRSVTATPPAPPVATSATVKAPKPVPRPSSLTPAAPAKSQYDPRTGARGMMQDRIQSGINRKGAEDIRKQGETTAPVKGPPPAPAAPTKQNLPSDMGASDRVGRLISKSELSKSLGSGSPSAASKPAEPLSTPSNVQRTTDQRNANERIGNKIASNVVNPSAAVGREPAGLQHVGKYKTGVEMNPDSAKQQFDSVVNQQKDTAKQPTSTPTPEPSKAAPTVSPPSVTSADLSPVPSKERKDDLSVPKATSADLSVKDVKELPNMDMNTKKQKVDESVVNVGINKYRIL